MDLIIYHYKQFKSLSGGEAYWVPAAQIVQLVGVLIFWTDKYQFCLRQRTRLINSLKKNLRDIGNSVLVVELW
jgi:excinuclease UvrABC ATPase subunit